MRIGVDANIFRFPFAGIARYLYSNLKYLMELNPQDEFILYSPQMIKIDLPAKNLSVKVGSGIMSKLGSFWFRYQGSKVIVDDRVDLFWGQNQILPERLPKKIQTVLTIHDLTHIRYPRSMPEHSYLISKVLFKKALKRANHLVAVSKSTARDLVDLLHVPTRKISIVYEGCDDCFRPVSKEEAKEKIIKKYGIEKEFILSVGTVSPRKNYLLLLKAFSKLKSYHRLVIAGPIGWKYRSIFSLIRNLALENKVIFLGRISDDDLVFFYNAATMMVYPSMYEGFGLPVLEAMSCGTPVICSNTSSLPEVGGNAVGYFDPCSEGELIELLKQVGSSQVLQKKMAEDGLKQAQKFSFRKSAEKIHEIFYVLCNTKTRRV